VNKIIPFVFALIPLAVVASAYVVVP